MTIPHPLPIGTKVEAMRPQCPCKGASFVKVSGTIGKIIPNHSGVWYYLSDTGATINGQWIISIDGRPLQ